jgi:hypothetical protein
LLRPFDRSEQVAWASDEEDAALVTDDRSPLGVATA